MTQPTQQSNGTLWSYIKRMRELTKSVAERNRKIHQKSQKVGSGTLSDSKK